MNTGHQDKIDYLEIGNYVLELSGRRFLLHSQTARMLDITSIVWKIAGNKHFLRSSSEFKYLLRLLEKRLSYFWRVCGINRL